MNFGAQLTDAGLKNLKELKNLTYLNLTGTRVTVGGFDDLKKELPKCSIFR